jgi:catechol 2,3-dioxygenase-like lactoylglutathione lyase family enzyme
VPEPVVSHIDLVVSDLARSLAFYKGLLRPIGFAVEREIVGERGEEVHYLRGDVIRGAIGLREAQTPAERQYDRYAVGLHHIAFEVESRAVVDERAAWLRGHGAEIESGPAEYDYTPGYYAVFFYDPDGLKLEILHRPAL